MSDYDSSTLRMSVMDLGGIKPCQDCGIFTYDPANIVGRLDRLLPFGFTRDNERQIITVDGQQIILCRLCLYKHVPGAPGI